MFYALYLPYATVAAGTVLTATFLFVCGQITQQGDYGQEKS